jgi:hypothetical protein
VLLIAIQNTRFSGMRIKIDTPLSFDKIGASLCNVARNASSREITVLAAYCRLKRIHVVCRHRSWGLDFPRRHSAANGSVDTRQRALEAPLSPELSSIRAAARAPDERGAGLGV